MVDVGGLYRITYNVYDENNALVTPSTISLQIYLPDGTAVTPQPIFGAPFATGKYKYDYPTTVPGLHTGIVTTTNPQTARGFSFYIDPLPVNGIISLMDGKNYLNMSQTVTTDDDEVLTFIRVATTIIEDKVGTVARRTIVDYAHPDGPSLWLRGAPVISVTSIVSSLFSFAPYAGLIKVADAVAGRVILTTGQPFLGGPWDVTYVAGRTIIPENLMHAAKQILRHLWDTQRGGMSFIGSGPGFNDDTETFAVSGREYTVPRRVLELLQPTKKGPRVA